MFVLPASSTSASVLTGRWSAVSVRSGRVSDDAQTGNSTWMLRHRIHVNTKYLTKYMYPNSSNDNTALHLYFLTHRNILMSGAYRQQGSTQPQESSISNGSPSPACYVKSNEPSYKQKPLSRVSVWSVQKGKYYLLVTHEIVAINKAQLRAAEHYNRVPNLFRESFPTLAFFNAFPESA